jgi:hypothetical protein
MPNLTTNLDVTIVGTETVYGGLNVNIAPLSTALSVAVASTQQHTTDLNVTLAFGEILLNASLDLAVAEGGAASQLFALDTTVSTPLILGSHIVADPGVAVPYTIANLDGDVVDIVLGPNAVGVAQVTSFVNNGDGTGQFLADFNTTPAARRLSIIAIDDVDNESFESPLFLVDSFERVTLSDELTIRPAATASSEVCGRLIDAVPESGFILKRQYTVPYSYNTTRFALRAITAGSPVEITVLRRGLPGDPGETQIYTIIPESETTSVEIRLCRGVNVVSVLDAYNRSDTVIVAATTYASVLCAYAREIYNNSRVLITEQSNAIYSPTSTRLAEPLINFQDLLPDVQSQQTLATKLAVRALINSPGRQTGVADLLTALTLSTPIFVPQTPHDTYFEPSTIPLFNAQESFGGVEAHVWPANECVRRWLAFVHYLQSLPVFQIVEVTENEVLFFDDNNDLQRHVFDFTLDECSLTTLALQATCFDNIDVGISIFSESDLTICAATYPFDMRPVPSAPIHPVGDEYGVEFALDPGFDGYTDFSLTGHWDGGETLDSQGAMPALGSTTPCVYADGYVVKPLLLASANAYVDEVIGIVAVGEPQVARAVGLEIVIDLNNVQRTTDLDINIRPTVLTTALEVKIVGVEEQTVDLNVAITA